MSKDRTDGGRHGSRYAVAATVALLVVGLVALFVGLRGQPGPPQPESAPPVSAPSANAPTVPGRPSAGASTTAAPTPTTAPAQPAMASVGPFLGASAPTRLDIPSIGVHAGDLVGLGIGTDGALTPPQTAQQVGWYTGGPTPGQLGPAVIGAHVDSKQGPGVFYRLGATRPGDQVTVTRADGTTTTFVVDKVATYPKDHFPTEEVYRGAFDRSEIRLITCGGTFDPVKHYLGNVVVFGHLTSTA
jgi:Sortase domain